MLDKGGRVSLKRACERRVRFVKEWQGKRRKSFVKKGL